MAKRKWAVAEAKAHFSDLVAAALDGEPQIVTRRGSDAVVVISAKAYRATMQAKRGSLVEFFARSPHRDIEIAPKRDRRVGREIKL